MYYEPASLIALLANGNLVSLGLLTVDVLPKIDELTVNDPNESVSPLKKILKEPFDLYIQNIVKKSSSQPILKLSGDQQCSQKECYEVLQRASQVFREYFENHTRAREEIMKRLKTLQMMKEFQLNELERMNGEKQVLQEKAEHLAEKYEDIKDKQEDIMKKCERLLVLVSQKKSEPSDAEKAFLDEINKFTQQIENYKRSIDKLKMKANYQKLQMKNWKAHEEKKIGGLSDKHYHTIKTNLEEM